MCECHPVLWMRRLRAGALKLSRKIGCVLAVALALTVLGMVAARPAQAGSLSLPDAPTASTDSTTDGESDPIRQAVPVGAAPELLIGIDPMLSAAEAEAWIRTHHLRLIKLWPEPGLALVADATLPEDRALGVASVSPDSLREMRDRIAALPGVRYAAYDLPVFAADRVFSQYNASHTSSMTSSVRTTPSDPRTAEQWAIPAMHAREGWAIALGHRSVPIAVIDSGTQFDHEDMAGSRLWTNLREQNGRPGVDDDGNGYVDDTAGWDWVDKDNRPHDTYGHGTHVSGIIGAVTGNGLGVAGLGRDSAILPLRVLDADGGGRLSDLIDALLYAQSRDVRIINLSLVIQFDSPALADTVAALARGGVMILAAAGNAADRVYWPAAYPETVAVAALDQAGARASFSNFGPEIMLAAPGVDVLAPYLNQDYAALSGTSMATAHVSSLVAHVWALRPDLNRDAVLAILTRTAATTDEAGFVLEQAYAGAGRIDFQAALADAADALVLAPAGTADRAIFTGEPGTINIRVMPAAGRDRGAAGAVVHYALLDTAVDPTLTPLVTGTVVTDADGIAPIAIDTPDKPTDCILRLTVGGVSTDLALAVRARPADLQLLTDQSVMSADAKRARLRIELRDAAGRLLHGEFPVQLTASRGVFTNGAAQTEVIARNGRAVLDFEPGSHVGVAWVRAQIGELQNEQRVEIMPGEPAKLELRQRPDPEEGGSDLRFVFRVADAYGNAVADGTPVRVFAHGGRVQSERVTTSGGNAVVQVQVDWTHGAQLELIAMVPGTRLQLSDLLQPAVDRIWLPFVTGPVGTVGPDADAATGD